MTSLPTALSSSGGGGKVVLVGVRLHQPNANLLWGGGSSSSSGGGAAISREGQALVEFTLARLVVPGDRIVAMAVRIVRAPHTSGSRKARFNSEQDGEEEEDASQRMLAALHPKIEVAAAKQITLQVVVRSAPRVRDALLYEAKLLKAGLVVIGPANLLKAGLVVIGPVRRTITLIGGSAGSDVDMMTFLADRLSASCKIMLVSNNACSATRQGRFADVATMMRLRKVPVPPTSPQSPRIDPGGGGGGSGMGEGGGGSGLGEGERGRGQGSMEGGLMGAVGYRMGEEAEEQWGEGWGEEWGEGGLWGGGGGDSGGGWQQCPRSPRSQSNGQDFFAPPPSPVPPAPPTEIIREVYGQDEYGQQEFYLDELLLATDNFSPQRLIGEGGSGQVFVGMLPPGRCPQVESQGGGSEGWGRGGWGEGGTGGDAAGGGAGGGERQWCGQWGLSEGSGEETAMVGAGCSGRAGGGKRSAVSGGAACVEAHPAPEPAGAAGGAAEAHSAPEPAGAAGRVCDSEGASHGVRLPAQWVAADEAERVLRRIRHPSLLGPLGVCAMAGDFLMVFDVLPNGSLQTRLRDHTKPPLPWDLRMRIACEAATGLAFLHSCRPPIIHRDVKAANVLLDANMHALVSDFGLAKVASDQYTQPMAVTSIMGTRGYVAPEYVQTGLITAAIDVYAFGVILLELITGHVPFHPGRQPPNLSAWAIPIANNEEFTRLVDYRLEGRYDLAQLQAVSMLAVLCLAANPKHRPPMDQAVSMLAVLCLAANPKHRLSMDQVRLVHRAGRGIERLDPAQLQAVSML
ncbi:unnamed protein product [Closterium sp. NIES-64]|nr:unnamed protein product [Closterium sp. NIES-64]